MRILYITTIGGTMNFFVELIKNLIDKGNTVDIATNDVESKVPNCFCDWGCKIFTISTSRSPFSLGNIKAIKQLSIIADGYDIVHCHTPIASIATRIACRKLRKKGQRVIYTAHGFHFYRGAPLKNWLLYYLVEKLCSRWTDVLITINKEDYTRACKCLNAQMITYIPGVGINTEKFRKTDDGDRIRFEFHISQKYILLSVGELNENKNHEAVIRALEKNKHKEDIIYVIVGKGDLLSHLNEVAKQKKVNVLFTGYRNDVSSFYKVADFYILPSIREGLNVSLMEAMASGLPCLASRIRGNVDLIDDGIGGYLFDPKDIADINNKIETIISSEKRHCFGNYNVEKVNQFDSKNVCSLIEKIYYGILFNGKGKPSDL